MVSVVTPTHAILSIEQKQSKLNGQQHRLVSTQILKDMSENMSICIKHLCGRNSGYLNPSMTPEVA